MSLTCDHCKLSFERARKPKAGKVYCSPLCRNRGSPQNQCQLVGPRLFGRATREASGCWLFPGNDGAFPAIWVNAKMHSVHRAAWMVLRGAIPDGLVVSHLCDSRRCINPDHLALVTPAKSRTKRYSAQMAKPESSKARCSAANKLRADSEYGEFSGARRALIELLREIRKRLPTKQDRLRARGYYERVAQANAERARARYALNTPEDRARLAEKARRWRAKAKEKANGNPEEVKPARRRSR